MKIFDWLKPAKHISRLPHEQVESAYRKYRINNFIGIFMGYAAYYLLRGNFSLAMPFLSKMGHYSKTDLGKVAGILTVAYGISKFIMGNISDRSNPRYFIAVGLAISVIVNLIFGLAPGITSSLLFMYVLMFTNGWAQGMGSPPCYRTVAHWYPISKRGEIMSAWNVAHNLGAAILGAISAYVIPNISFLNWQAIFYLPAIITIMIIVSVVLLMRDTPQSVGLMPVEEYSNEYPENADKQSLKEGEKELSAKEIIFKYVLVNKYVWFLGLANIFVYFIRYGVLNWAPLYLTEVKGLVISKSGISYIIYELAGIAGMLFCGYISDKLFKGKRAPVSMISMTIVFAGVMLYWLSNSIAMNYLALFMIGMFIYGPVMLVGVQVVDLMPKKAVGTTIGLLGLFGYWGGSLGATAGFGVLVDIFGWNGGFLTLAISCALAIFFFSLTLRIKSVTKNAKK